MVRGRRLLVPGDKDQIYLKDMCEKIATELEQSPAVGFQPDTLVKLAETIDILDRKLRLRGRYTDVIPRPEDVIFSCTLSKMASDLERHVSTTTGKLYEKDAFSRVPLQELQDLFGSEFVAQVRTPFGRVNPEKMAEVVSTLPRPDANLLDAVLQQNGIYPTATREVTAGFSDVELAKAAMDYAGVTG
jgi:hypothetical protein